MVYPQNVKFTIFARDPADPREAAEICMPYAESTAITKLLLASATYCETFESTKNLFVINGDVFDCALPYTVKGNIDTIRTENIRCFKDFDFISAENPLEWKWEER